MNSQAYHLTFIFYRDPSKCPDLHVYVVGLSPHNCVIISQRKECQGLAYVQCIKWVQINQQCHPNFEPNLRSPFIFQNFSVDPNQPITLEQMNRSSKILFHNNIQLIQFSILKNKFCFCCSKNVQFKKSVCKKSLGFWPDSVVIENYVILRKRIVIL